MQNYEVNNISIATLLSNIEEGLIAIPEIQRPFVWKATQVRDLIDSLYKGYPVGYIITWKNADTRLKDGSISEGKKIIIDGQQRITALSASLKGRKVINNKYRHLNIRIAFNPIQEKFEVWNSAISKSVEWIEDISELFSPSFEEYAFINEYAKRNDVNPELISKCLRQLTSINTSSVGVIDLPSNIDIEEVTEIFVRINSEGVQLSQADFAMSRVAANSDYGGPDMRKAIDYFCHLLERPQDYENIKENDQIFSNSEYFNLISWIKDQPSVFQPSYKDMIRIIFGYKFKRGRLRDFVALLSGRNFEKRTNEEEIVESSFRSLKEGILDFTNQHNFRTYLNRLANIGMVRSNFIQSDNVLNFGYLLFLLLKEKGIDSKVRDKCVERWLILTILTNRYSSSPESAFQMDITNFVETTDPRKYIDQVEESELSDTFWNVGYIERLSTSYTPTFYVFIMAQITAGDRGFLSTEKVDSMMLNTGDTHHIFPKSYLQSYGYYQSQYNQIANYAMVNKETNIKIGKQPPEEYLKNFEDSEKNYLENAIPNELETMDIAEYDTFLNQRRRLMSEKIRNYYEYFK